MTQYVINIGAIPNDGTGDPLRTAFNETNLNFDQVFAAGPVLSNIQIANNTILTTNTNGNLILAPNGTGVVQSNVSIVPNLANIRNLGSATNRWATVYTQYLNATQININGDLTVDGNLTVQGNIIQIGNIVTDSLTIQLANTATTTGAADGSGITVGANDNIATILYNSTGNVWTTNIGVSAVGNISAPYFVGNGSLLTGLAATYGNANVAAYLPTFTGNIATGNLTANTVDINGNIWSFTTTGAATGGGYLYSPTGGSWYSDPNYEDDFIYSGPGGFINIGTLHANSAYASQIHLEQDVTQIIMGPTGAQQIWSFDDFGNLTLPGNTFAVNYANGDPVAINSSSYGNANVATFLANFGSNTISTVGNITSNYYFGNAAVLAGQNTRGEHAANLGTAGFTELNSNVILQITANANSYAQINFQNIGNGTAATTDYIATAQFGDDSTYFVDMGIASGLYDSSNPNNSLGTSLYAQDSYLYAMGGNSYGGSGGNLVVGSNEPGGVVRIIADGSTTDNIVATFSNIGIDVKGNINFNGGSITQALNEDLYIRASDDENDGWSIYNVVDDGGGNILSQTRLEYNQYSITTDVQGAFPYTWLFRESGQLDLPGDIAGNVGGNLTVKIVDQAGSDTFIDLQTRSYVGDALISNIRIANPNITVSTASGVYNWTFDSTGNLNLPPSGNIVGVTANNNGYINWLGNSSGDGYGYTTMRLIPDDTIGGDSYLIIDPTAPNHIHIRAGGTQDNSSAQLFLGGENSYFLVENGANSNVYVASNSNQWKFDTTGVLTVPGEGIIQSLNDTVILQSNDTVTGNIYSARLGTNGGLYFATTQYPTGWLNIENNAGNANITSPMSSGGAAGHNLNLTAGATDTGAYTNLPGGNLNLVGGTGGFNDDGIGGPGGDVNITAGAPGESAGLAGNVNITAGTAAWTFNNNSQLTVANLTISASNGIGSQASIFEDDGSLEVLASGTNGLVNIGWANNASTLGNTAVMWFNEPGNVGNVVIRTGNTAATSYTWAFDNTGVATLPGGSRLRPLGANLDIFAGTGSYVNLITSDESSYMGVGGAGGYVVTAGGTWNFNTNGNLTAPGNVSAVGNITGGNIVTSGSGGDITMSSGNITGAGNISAGNVSTTGNVTAANFFGNGSQLTGVAGKTTGTWNVTAGTNNYSFTVEANNTYQLWVNGNIPNGIIVYNATVSVSNTNVPVIGQQFAWNYEGAGNPITFTSIPAQIIGTANAISNANPSVGTTTNTFTFGINNSSGNTVTVNYGYTKIS